MDTPLTPMQRYRLITSVADPLPRLPLWNLCGWLTRLVLARLAQDARFRVHP